MERGAHSKRVLVAGASGTIGRAVVHACHEAGHHVTALSRSKAALPDGVAQVIADFADANSLETVLNATAPDTVISCIASRSGAPKDAQAVDFQANLSLLKAAESAGADHFILLSAICVQKPRLAFQHAKIAFERALKASAIDHTIVRPTAFFKSLSGQVERVAKGKPFFVFGDGELTRCKPISDRDLARFIADCVSDPARRNAVLPIGGPGPAISLNDQAGMLSEVLGREVPTRAVPLWLFGAFERLFALAAPISSWAAEKAEYARIARYYATESMLLLDPATGEYNADATPEFGADRLIDHYRELLKDAQ